MVIGVTHLFKNLYRAFFRYASKACKIIHLGIQSVIESISCYTDGVLTGTPASSAFILHDRDLDQTAFVPSGNSVAEVQMLHARLDLKTAVFQLGARIMSIGFKAVVDLVSGLAGWARLLISLVKSLPALKPLYTELKAYQDTLKALD